MLFQTITPSFTVTKPVNNTKNECEACKATRPSPSTAPKHLRLAVGGDVSAFTPQALDKLKSMGITEIHAVVPDAGTYPDVLHALTARGMTAVYDGEQPFWHDRNCIDPFSQQETQQLFAIYGAGWRYFSSEGLFGSQVGVIDNIGFQYISYGGDLAQDLYGSPFSHAAKSHYANYQEAYDTNIMPQTSDRIYYQGKLTPKHNGILFGLWDNPSPESGGPNPITQPGYAVKAINDLNAGGAHITEAVFWCGIGNSPLPFITGIYQQEFNSVKSITIQE